VTQDKEEFLNSKKLTTFNLFHWNRIMLDEAHEIQNNSKITLLKDTISSIDSTYKWNITGTPFANGVDGFLNLMAFNTSLQHKNVTNSTVFDIISAGINEKMVTTCNKLFRCNTKDSIKDEHSGNLVMSHVKLLEFTKQERSIYNSYIEGNRNSDRFSEYLIKICCHSELYNDTKELIQNCKTLDEIQEVILEYNKKRIESITKILDSINRLLCAKQVQLDEERDEELKTSLRIEIGTLKRSQTHHKVSLEDTQRTFNYLKNAIDNIESPDNCPVCLEQFQNGDLCITRCGHKFCWDCVSNCHNARGGGIAPFKCPSCNTFINKNEIYKLTDNMQTHDELSSIINKIKSTKIGNIIHHIKNELDSNDKVILFSQWESLLHKVGNHLEDYKLNVVYCNGSIYQRKNAIDSFIKDPTVKVILLSSRNAASGINLTIANKIILLEPVYGTKEYRKNIENQIIGRANRIGQTRPIDVLRFIIKDTIEEDIINNNIDDTRIRQFTLN
jgi:SNF2 family DNA or RNA helicase